MTLETDHIFYTDNDTEEFACRQTRKFFLIKETCSFQGFIGKYLNESIQSFMIADLLQIVLHNDFARQSTLLNVGMKLSY